MAGYRIFMLARNGKIIARVEIERHSDEEAILEARQILEEEKSIGGVEVGSVRAWCIAKCDDRHGPTNDRQGPTNPPLP